MPGVFSQIVSDFFKDNKLVIIVVTVLTLLVLIGLKVLGGMGVNIETAAAAATGDGGSQILTVGGDSAVTTVVPIDPGPRPTTTTTTPTIPAAGTVTAPTTTSFPPTTTTTPWVYFGPPVVTKAVKTGCNYLGGGEWELAYDVTLKGGQHWTFDGQGPYTQLTTATTEKVAGTPGAEGRRWAASYVIVTDPENKREYKVYVTPALVFTQGIDCPKGG